MRKRILALLLVAALLPVVFAACGKGEAEQPPEVTITRATDAPARSAAKGDKTVKITLPLAYVEEDYRGALEAYRINRGFLDLRVNDKKQTVTIKLTERGWRLLLTDIGLQVIEGVYGMVDNPAYAYLKSVDELDEEAYRSVTVSVDRVVYDADENAAYLPFILASRCMTYQAYTKKNRYQCEVTVKDAATGEVLSRETFKDKN